LHNNVFLTSRKQNHKYIRLIYINSYLPHLSNAAQSRGVIIDLLALFDPDGPGQQLSE